MRGSIELLFLDTIREWEVKAAEEYARADQFRSYADTEDDDEDTYIDSLLESCESASAARSYKACAENLKELLQKAKAMGA